MHTLLLIAVRNSCPSRIDLIALPRFVHRERFLMLIKYTKQHTFQFYNLGKTVAILDDFLMVKA